MTLTEVIRAAGDFVPFRRPCHAIPSYYNGHVKDFHQRTHLAFLSLEDLEATDWELCNALRKRGKLKIFDALDISKRSPASVGIEDCE